MLALRGHTGPVRCLAYSPDGQLLVSGGDDRIVRLWDRSGKQTWSSRKAAHTDSVRALTFSPSGKHLLSAGWDGRCCVWSFPPHGRPESRVGKDKSGYWSMACNLDGSRVVLGCLSGQIMIQTHHNPLPFREWKGHEGVVRAVQWCPTGKHLYSAGDDGFIRVWDPDWGQERQVLGRHTDWVCCLAVSNDGRSLASGSADGQIRLWDLIGRREVSAWNAHAERVTHLAWNDRGNTLFSAGWDGLIRVWSVDGSSSIPRNALDFRIGRVNAVAISPDGMTAAAGGQDGCILLWDLDD